MSTPHAERLIPILLLASLLGGCSEVNVPNAPTTDKKTTTTPAPPARPAYHVEFRVFGNTQGALVTVHQIDSIEGLTQYTGSVPYVQSLEVSDDSIFLYLDATATPLVFGNLQAQIFINGRLFREGAATSTNGQTLYVQASGTYRASSSAEELNEDGRP